MSDVVLDLLLPKTDRMVLIQTIVMGLFWLVVIFATWRRSRDVRHFIWGLATMNAAWFAFRTVH